jgi:hypothetical protein
VTLNLNPNKHCSFLELLSGGKKFISVRNWEGPSFGQLKNLDSAIEIMEDHDWGDW